MGRQLRPPRDRERLCPAPLAKPGREEKAVSKARPAPRFPLTAPTRTPLPGSQGRHGHRLPEVSCLVGFCLSPIRRGL